jgi:FkbM family methyltransferase
MSLATKFSGLLECLRFDNALQLVAARLLFRRTRFVPHRLGGAQFIADQLGGDECGLRPCLVGGMYDPFLEASEIYQSPAPWNIADLGANAGGFSLFFTKHLRSVGKIAAIEMNPLTYSRMRLNLLTNFGPAAVPINAAVGGVSGWIEVPFTFGSTGESVQRGAVRGAPGFSIQMVTFDDFLNSQFGGGKVDLVKMDIEGAEWDVLASEHCSKLRDCRHLLVEVHPRAGRGLSEFKQLVSRFGFELLEIRNAAAEDVFCFRNTGHFKYQGTAE